MTLARALVVEGLSQTRATLSSLIKSFPTQFLLKVILEKILILSQPGHFYNTVCQQEKKHTKRKIKQTQNLV